MWPRDLKVLRYWGFKEEFKENQKLSHKDLMKAVGAERTTFSIDTFNSF